MAIEIHRREDGSSTKQTAPRSVARAMWRGLWRRCPNCRRGKMFDGYLKVAHACKACGEELHHQRADDAPPYFTLFIVGHVVIGALLSVEMAYSPPAWVQFAIWIPVSIVATLVFLPLIKGALIGLQWACRMHGFGGASEADEMDRFAPPLNAQD